MTLSTSHASPPQALQPTWLSELIGHLEAGGPFNPSRAVALLRQLDVDASDLQAWFELKHPASNSYGRRLVSAGVNYELMVMSWEPGDYSAIHDHGAAEWGAVRYFGAADHVVFEEAGGILSMIHRMTMQAGDVCAVDHDLIHLMGNPTSQPFVSLHLYGRAQAADAITCGARIFDLYENRIQRTDGGVFFCLPERDITSREPCPDATKETRLLHHRLMLARLERMQASGMINSDLASRIPLLRGAIDRLEAAQEP